MDVLEGLALNFTEEEKLEAKELDDKMLGVASLIREDKQRIDKNYVVMSQYLDKVRSKKYWLLGSFKSFGEYLNSCETRFGIKHSQLYVGMSVTRNLLPSISEDELVEIGITRASMLSKYVEQSGTKKIPEDMLNFAKDSTKTANELEQVVNNKLHNVVPDSKTKWFSLNGFYADEDERAEITEALAVAKSIDPVIPNNIPQWQQDKEALLRLCREFRSTYV